MATTKKRTKTQAPAEVVSAYKGFNQSLQCRGFQFEIGKTYEHEGEVKACASGFHSCEYPLDVFNYYNPAGSRFAVVKASGKLSRHEGDSKVASATITVEAEIGLPVLVARAVDWVLGKLDKSIEQTLVTGNKSAATNTGYQSAATNTGYQSAATNTGYQSAATNTGDYSAATNTGDYSAATNTGYQSAATNTGNYSAATNTGNKSAATNTGDYSAATNTGNYSAATNTGYQSAATNTGNYSAATNTGNKSAATNTGNYSAATNTGNYSAATNTGDYSAAEVKGAESVAASLGIQGRTRAAAGGAIVLCYRDENDGRLIHIRASKVGESGIKPDTWYALDATGEFVEVETESEASE